MNNHYTTNGLNVLYTGTHSPLKFITAHKSECSPRARCHNHKECKACHDLWRRAQWSRACSHLTEKHLKSWKYKEYLVIASLKDGNAIQQAQDLENFLNEWVRSGRYKSSLLHKSQYFTSKHVSKTEGKGYFPHVNMLFLSNNSFKHNRHLKQLLSKYNLRIKNTPISKDQDNSYKTSIYKLINYFLKWEKSRAEFEDMTKFNKGKREIRKSALFSKRKMMEKDRRLYNHIAQAKALYNQKRKEAIAIYKRNRHHRPRYVAKLHRSMIRKIEKLQKQLKTALFDKCYHVTE